MRTTINIDLDTLLEIALSGVRRAAIFMGLGVNAAIDDDFQKYQLSNLTNIQLIPDNVSADTIKHFKEEFRLWIEACGFRELVDTFANYLDSVHHSCLLMKSKSEKLLPADISNIQAKYQRKGFPEKLDILIERFAVSPAYPSYLLSLNRVRNCLTHRRGIVGDEDLHGKTELSIKWFGLDVFIQEPDGKKHLLNEMRSSLQLKNGGLIMAGFNERNRNFNRGDKLILSTRDLAEICWFYDYEAKKIRKSTLEFAAILGVKVKTQVASK